MTKRLHPEKPGSPTYRQIWRIVDGAVNEALKAHPEYLASKAKARTVRNSITKRVVGAITGYAEQSAWVRSGSSSADETADASLRASAMDEVVTGPSRDATPLRRLSGRES